MRNRRRGATKILGTAIAPIAALSLIALQIGACGGETGGASATVSNITAAQCTHTGGGFGVQCALTMDVDVNGVTFHSGTAKFVTTSLLMGEYVNVGVGTSYAFPHVHLIHDGVACVGPQTTLAIFDGDAEVVNVEIGPIYLSCN